MGCHREHRRRVGRTSPARGVPAQHLRPLRTWEGRAAGRKWGLPESAKYRKETDTSLALWLCQKR